METKENKEIVEENLLQTRQIIDLKKEKEKISGKLRVTLKLNTNRNYYKHLKGLMREGYERVIRRNY